MSMVLARTRARISGANSKCTIYGETRYCGL